MSPVPPKIVALLVASLFFGSAMAAPVGYIVNSDGPNADADSLFEVDLATGDVNLIGKLQNQLEDVEGLAMASDGRLYAADDATDTVFVLSRTNASAALFSTGVSNLAIGGNPNGDYGLAFGCQGQLYMSSDTNQTLYTVDLDSGVAKVMGANGGLNTPISGIAVSADGVFGLGALGAQSLFRIDPDAGTATEIGPLGLNFDFEDAGLAFDADGTLWGVADRRSASVDGSPSVIFQIDVETGAARRIAETIIGVESLAIAPPPCGGAPTPAALPVPSLNVWLQALLALLVGGVAWLRLRPGASLS